MPLSNTKVGILMRMMHTTLPEFLEKIKAAAAESNSPKAITIRGLENLTSAKMQSLRTGRIEIAVDDMTKKDGVKKVDLVVMPRIPETMHTVVVRGLDDKGNVKSAILEIINIMHPTEDALLKDCGDVEDRRPPIGKH